MLQQTQVDRVIPKYQQFLKKYSSFSSLASASFKEVFSIWQGLGYNRRAKYLLQTAQVVMGELGGKFPREHSMLTGLPGIGSYTANAILTFAFNERTVFIETNIRSVFIHFFFPNSKNKIADKDLLPLIEKTLPSTGENKKVREWYWALMDYGAMLKQTERDHGRESSGYRPQKKFKGSLREVRGAILKGLVREGVIKESGLRKKIPFPNARFRPALESLLRDGLVEVDPSRGPHGGRRLRLAS